MSGLAGKLQGKTTRLAAAPQTGAKPPALQGRLMNLEVARIKPDPNQPRKYFDPAGLDELARSLIDHGLLEPVVVRLVEGDPVLIAGERRWRAAKRAGMPTLPAMVRQVGEKDAAVLSLVENLHREDLGPLEEAEALDRLRAQGLSLKEVASLADLAVSTVSEKLSLVNLPEAIKEDLRKNPRALSGRNLVEVAKLAKRTGPREAEILYKRALTHGLKRADFRTPKDQPPALPEPEPTEATGEQETDKEPERALHSALHSMAGAAERWARRIGIGLEDAELRAAIGYEFGTEGGSAGPDMVPYTYKGGVAPGFWFDAISAHGKPTLAGKRLIDTVRVILGVPYPGREQGETPKEKEPAKPQKGKDVPYHAARLKQGLLDLMKGPRPEKAAWRDNLLWELRTLPGILAQALKWLESPAQAEGKQKR